MLSPHSFILSFCIWAVGPSALPCAGAAPPQRPPTKPSLTDRVCSFQPCRSQQRGCRLPNTHSDSLNCGSDKGLVRTDSVDGLVVTFILLKRRSFVSNRVGRSSGRYWSGVVDFSFKPGRSSDRDQEFCETSWQIYIASVKASIPADSVEIAFDDVAFSVTVILPESNRSQRGSGHYQRLYEPITRSYSPTIG